MPEKTLPITKVQVGHVIGPKGATIKSIQEDTGASVEIVNDGPAVHITAEEQSQVDAAEKMINKLVENQENPDYEGPEGARLRQEANELGDKRGNLFDKATKKRAGGDHDGAHKLTEQAKQAGEDMAARHREAAAAIAKYNNEDKGKGEEYFDMHGLREEEAMDMLKTRIAALEDKPSGTTTEFEVVPGAGHHSGPGGQKLKGATGDFLKEKGIPYEPVSAGSFLAKVAGKGEGEPSSKKPKAEEKKEQKKEKKPAAAEKKDEKKPATQQKDAQKDKKGDKPAAEKKDKKVMSKKSCCTVM